MKRCTFAFVEPIAWVERQQFQFGSVGQIRRLVNHEATGSHMCLDGHANERIIGRAAHQALAAVGARFIMKRRG